MWEKKLAADGSDGGNCTDAAQADRSVHCVNNTYIWSAGGGGGTAADGTLFTVFLHTLNNKCDGDETTQCDGDADCAVANGGPGGQFGFAGYRDWRLPEVDPPFGNVDTAELETILLEPFPCGTSPCIDETIFGPTAASFYWSAITEEGVHFAAWLVSFDDGSFSPTLKRLAEFHARAVRSCP